jgi:hypothetical protein
MPNWVFNRLTFSGDAATLEALEAQLATAEPDQVVLSFQKVTPRPPEAEDDWYDWNVANWGTKWDAHRPQVERSDGTVAYVFDTAWSPPLPVVERVALLFPTATVRLDYQEEQGWGGSLELQGSALLYQDSYDVPESHAEVVARGGACSCDEEFQPFDDCWAERAAAQGVSDVSALEAVRALAPNWEGTFSELVETVPEL